MAVEYVVLSPCTVLDKFGGDKIIHFSLRTQQVHRIRAMLKNHGITGDEALDKSITLREYIDDEIQVTNHSLRSMMKELEPFQKAALACTVHGHDLQQEQSRWGTLHYPISAATEKYLVFLMKKAVAGGHAYTALFKFLKKNEVTFSGKRHAAMRRYGRDDDKPRPQTELKQALSWEWNNHTFNTDQLFEFLFFQDRMTPEHSALIHPFITLASTVEFLSEMDDKDISDIEQYFTIVKKSYTEGVDIIFKS